ncbi:MAG: peptidoglycan DD-metalloendopeptidase family protein [Thermodesulfobacteriota bacterium]
MRPFLLLALVGSSVVLSLLFLLSPEASSRRDVDQYPAENLTVARPDRYDIKVTRNDTFYSIMSRFNVAPSEIYRMARVAKPICNLSRLRSGTKLSVVTLKGRVDRVLYGLNAFELFVLKRNDNVSEGYKAGILKLPTEVRVERASGEIETSLYEAGVQEGVDPGIILSLSDIMAWDVDFATDIRKGDTFSILYEKTYVEGRPVKTGRILGAEIVNNGRTYSAVYFKDGRGRPGYYDLKGRSLRRLLLKSPLRYSRITSYFSRRRYHPILKRYRPHHGVDYAAPRGTPIETTGSGRVEFAGWKKGYGRFVVVKHSNGFKTGYGHMSRIKRGIRRGVRVAQGDVVGYVGSTGISTGPHLHYEVKKRGRFLNPLNIRSNPKLSVSRREMARFAKVKNDTIARLKVGGSVMTAGKDF